MHTARKHSLNRGFTLVEVLVALLVLSIGLLGVAKLIMYSARGNDSAYLRTQATQMAYTILEDMRANRPTAALGAFDTAYGTMPALGVDCSVGACTNNQMAQYDVWAWKQRLKAGATNGALPNGQGQIVTVTAGAVPNVTTTATISVQWDDAVAATSYDQTIASTVAVPMVVTIEAML